MKTFLIQNWYRLSISISLLLFAFGFAVRSIKLNTATAGEPTYQYNKNVDGEGFYESHGSLYQVRYNSFDYTWKANKILYFEEQ